MVQLISDDDRDPHHGLQPRRRALRVSQGRAGLLHAAHRKTARVLSVLQGQGGDQGRRYPRRHHAAARDARRIPAAVPGDRGAADGIGMAAEPARHRRGEEDADGLLQFLPRISADLPQPLRRERLGQDHLPHDPRRRLAADQHPQPRAPDAGGRGASSLTGSPRSADPIRRTRISSCSRGRRGGRPKWSSPNTNCRGSTSPAHDTGGDAQGQVWYSTHRSSYVGRLDPANGHVEEFRVPLPPQANALPGTHWIFVDPKGSIWGSENWAHNIWTLDPRPKNFRRVRWNVQEPINSPMGGNYCARRGRQHLAPA